jgi:uncharacterized protein YkwD
MWNRIADWLLALGLPQRRWLAGISALVLVAGVALGLAAVTGGDGGGERVALETEGDDTTTSTDPADTSSTTSTTSTVAGDEDDEGATSSSSTSSTKAPGRTTSTTRGTASGPATTKAPGGTNPTGSSTTTTTATSSTEGVTRDAGVENSVASLFTVHRESLGRPAMERRGSMDQVAVDWARHLAETRVLDHQPGSTIEAACPTTCTYAENVAYAQSAQGVWNRWLGSAPHKANIEDGRAGYFGVGAFRSADGDVWVVHVFGRTG